jgi:hypothetical protein
MPEDDSLGESGTQTGDSTVQTADTGSDQISDNTPATDSATAAVDAQPAVVKKDEDDMTLEELADQAAAEKLENESAADKKDQVAPVVPEAPQPKSIKEARSHIDSLEGQIKPLREMEATVQEIGGMPVIEASRPLIDTVMNPESTAAQIFEALQEVAPHHDIQSLAWGLLDSDENQAAAITHFFGDDVTPDILEKLVNQYKSGSITLDTDAEDADEDIFLTEKEKADRAKSRDTEAKNKSATTLAKEAAQTKLEGERTAAATYVSTALERSVNEAIKDFAIDEKNDTDEMKTLKGTLTQAVHAMTMVELSRDPSFQRVQALIQKNGGKAAQALTDGALSKKVADRSAAIMKILEPLFTSGIAGMQKAAQKIKGTRQEPTGALGQADATRGKEITSKSKTWRADLDAEFEGRINDLKTKQARTTRGQFA